MTRMCFGPGKGPSLVPPPTQEQFDAYPPREINTTAEQERAKDAEAIRQIGERGTYTPGGRESDRVYYQSRANRDAVIRDLIEEETKLNARRRARDWWQGKDWPEAAD